MYKAICSLARTLSFGALCLMVFLTVGHNCAIAQPNYTPGDNSGSDWYLYLYAPFAWEYTDGMQAYLDHVYGNTEGTTGQRYAWENENLPTDWYQPDPGPDECTLPIFEEILGSCSDDLGTLLIQSHGLWNRLAVEVYANSTAGYEARNLAYDLYLNEGYPPEQIDKMTSPDGNYCIAVTDSYLRAYGQLDGALVFVGACYSESIIDDLVNPYYANARVAMGVIGEQDTSIVGGMIDQIFYRMDGKFGQWCRPVSCAKIGLDSYLAVAGEENTVLTVAVESIDYPSPIKLGDTITITFDTKCDTYAWPDIWCDWCEWGEICEVGWEDDSLTFKATFCGLPPSGIDEVEATLGWDHVWSARNYACLDGNTNPWGGGNAEGPAHDDYVWTMAVAPCFCGTYMGDMDNTGTPPTPLDVSILVAYVYKQDDYRVYPEDWNCPYDLGDLNCDDSIDPVDVSVLVMKVYKSQDVMCEPCAGYARGERAEVSVEE